MKLQSEFKPLFWDVDYRRVDPIKRKRYVIERVLMLGQQNHLRWLFQKFSKRLILSVARTSRALDQKSRSFWLTYLKPTHASRRTR